MLIWGTRSAMIDMFPFISISLVITYEMLLSRILHNTISNRDFTDIKEAYRSHWCFCNADNP